MDIPNATEPLRKQCVLPERNVIFYIILQSVSCSLSVMGFGESIMNLIGQEGNAWVARGIAFGVVLLLLGKLKTCGHFLFFPMLETHLYVSMSSCVCDSTYDREKNIIYEIIKSFICWFLLAESGFWFVILPLWFCFSLSK